MRILRCLILLGGAVGVCTAPAQEMTYLPTGPGPYWVSAADVNQDGRTDFVLPNRGELLGLELERPANDTMTVYLSDEGGRRRVEREVGFGPYTSQVADLDGDGSQDIVVANFHEHRGRHLSFFYGEEPGGAEHLSIDGDFVYDKGKTSQGDPTYPTPGLTSVKAADLNSDGRPDLVAVAWSSDFLVVLLNEGERRYRQIRYETLPGPRDVEVADVNRDGRLDFVVTVYTSNLMEVWLQGADGGFAKEQLFWSHGATPYHLKLGDLNADGWVDLIVGNRSTNDNVAVFHNREGRFDFSGSVSPGTVRPGESTADEIRDVLLADVNGDDVLDLLAACHVSHKVVWWEGTQRDGYNEAFGKKRVLLLEGKGPRALADDGDDIIVALFDSNELGIAPKALLRGLPVE